jgi:hypothetical protein
MAVNCLRSADHSNKLLQCFSISNNWNAFISGPQVVQKPYIQWLDGVRLWSHINITMAHIIFYSIAVFYLHSPFSKRIADHIRPTHTRWSLTSDNYQLTNYHHDVGFDSQVTVKDLAF